MHPAAPSPEALPLNVVFPEAYRASCREITRDFAYFAAMIVGMVVSAAAIGVAL